MEEPRPFEEVYPLEREARAEENAKLDELSGFHRLSEKQQQYVRASLYIQDRAERGTDAGSAARVHSMQVFCIGLS